MHTHETLFAEFERLGIAYRNHEHQPLFTVEEAKAVDAGIPGCHIKNLFLRDKKKTGLWLVTTLHDCRVDLKSLKSVIGAQGNLSFGNEELLWEMLGVRPGSVTPLAPVNDTNRQVKVYLDRRIREHAIVNPHPLRNDMTVSISPTDLERFLCDVHTSPTWLDIPEVTEEVTENESC